MILRRWCGITGPQTGPWYKKRLGRGPPWWPLVQSDCSDVKFTCPPLDTEPHRLPSSCVLVQFGNKAVAQVACDAFQLLTSHWEHLKRLESTLPKKIIEVTHAKHEHLHFSPRCCVRTHTHLVPRPWLSWWIAASHPIISLLVFFVCFVLLFFCCFFVPTQIFVATIAFLLPSAEHSTVEADKKVHVGKEGTWNGWDLKALDLSRWNGAFAEECINSSALFSSLLSLCCRRSHLSFLLKQLHSHRCIN